MPFILADSVLFRYPGSVRLRGRSLRHLLGLLVQMEIAITPPRLAQQAAISEVNATPEAHLIVLVDNTHGQPVE